MQIHKPSPCTVRGLTGSRGTTPKLLCTSAASPAAHRVNGPGGVHLPRPETLSEYPTPARKVACNFQQTARNIEAITKTKGGSFADSSPTRDGPVMLAFDATEDSVKSLMWTLSNVCCPGEPGEQLELVHVICDPRGLFGGRTAVGCSESGRLRTVDSLAAMETSGSYQAYAQRLVNEAQRAVEDRCGQLLKSCGVPHQVHLPQIGCPRSASVIGETLLREAERVGARALVVANHGPGAMAEYGSVARYCYQHASLPLILIPSSNRAYFGTQSFDAEQLGANLEVLKNDPMAIDADVQRAAPATYSHVRPHLDSADEMQTRKTEGGAADAKAGVQHKRREVMLVVTHLPELEAHWQWVADNLCRQGDVLTIWHMHMSAPTSPAMLDSGSMASLPTALAQVLRARGLADVKYSQHYYEDNDTKAAARKVVAAAEAENGPRMVCMLNYSRQGMVQEAIRGSVASELARHCPVPLVLLQPAA